jgi:hypothetical protein
MIHPEYTSPTNIPLPTGQFGHGSVLLEILAGRFVTTVDRGIRPERTDRFHANGSEGA